MSKDSTGEPSSGLGRRSFLAGSAAVASTGLAGCAGTLADRAREVNVAGSSTVFPITEVVASEFSKERDDVTVSISQTGTGGGFSNFFCPGMTDINNASRGIADVEREQCGENGIDPIEFTVATDALTVVVSPDLEEVDCLTVEELRELWREGGADRWSDVREEWPDEEIEFFGADTTSGTFDYFAETILEEDDTHRTDYHATERDRTIVQGIQGNRYAMGYFGFAYYDENPEQVKGLEIDDGDGCVGPSLETAREGEYTPLSRPLYIYAARESLERPEVRDFVRFYLERSSTDLINEVGYVPVSEEVRDENLEKFEEVVEEVVDE
ncbi:phosphate ABC transporter substrate-binding protein, PhoT family [Halobiforma haloterrestris]|uniref:Phosphate ABC transporter substrate-binding protein, PhoT family n=1 Tax=Natronobacterium haloterrestre TaxID=148448 RepID=A0A1I1KQG0_NATHA|nr:phosphate ABC transporter substrate-binding protein PstS family protein [Halobiforma haloterrestris]SFC63029.1 phosphate ABC transporter substrate-binding protein, PhoT family [Halobiforma haloterrestris]